MLCLAFSRHGLNYVGVSVSHFIFKLIFANDLYSWICNVGIRSWSDVGMVWSFGLFIFCGFWGLRVVVKRRSKGYLGILLC